MCVSCVAAALSAAVCSCLTATTAGGEEYRYNQVPFTSVEVEGGFWGPGFRTNRDVTLWHDFRRCEDTGRIANFSRAGGLGAGRHQGHRYDDSDVFKVIEGAAYALAQRHSEKLDRYLDDLTAKIAAAQEDDGYVFTARTLGERDREVGARRWSHLRASHELYNAGHLYEAAAAHYRATSKRSLLDVGPGSKMADLG